MNLRNKCIQVAPSACVVLMLAAVVMWMNPPAKATATGSAATQFDLPGFALPWAKELSGSIFYTGGPHAYNTPDLNDTYPAGAGSGLDFAGGSFKVLAMAAGVVEEADTSCSYGGFGCVIAIRHFTGQSVMLYAHLQPGSFQVTAGQRVQRGDELAIAGNSGMDREDGEPAIHLHIELRDGAANCLVTAKYCIRHNGETKWGNPLDWGDLFVPVDGYVFTSYQDGDGTAYNYDGTAIKGPIQVLTNFKYIDGDRTRSNVVAWTHEGFTCDPTAVSTCELHSNPNDPVGTQFAGGGRFPPEVAAAAVGDYGGRLVSSNENNSLPPTFDTLPPYVGSFDVALNGGTANLSVADVSDSGSGVREVRYSAKWNNQWYGIGNTYQAPYALAWNMCNSGVPNGAVEFGMEVWDNAGNVFIWSRVQTNPTRTKAADCGGAEPTPVPQSCVNIGAFDQQYAYFWSESNCTGDISWFSAHPSNGPGASRQKSAFVPSGAVLLIAGENDGNGRWGCLANSVQNLSEIGWENGIEWAQVSYSGCPPSTPIATPPPDNPPVTCGAPSRVTVNTPYRGSTFSSGGPAESVSFSWNFASSTTGYQFQAARDPAFQQIVYDYHTPLSWTTADFWGGTYYARVRSENVSSACDLKSEWTDLGWFEVTVYSCADIEYTHFNLGWYYGTQCDTLISGGVRPLHVLDTVYGNQASAVWLKDGYSIRVFDNADGTGLSRCLSSTATDLSTYQYESSSVSLNDTIESYILYDLPACQQPPAPPPPMLPARPENLRQVDASAESITLAWDDVSSNEREFQVFEWENDKNNWRLIAHTFFDTNSYVRPMLQCGMTKLFKVAAENEVGLAFSEWITAHTTTCPTPLLAPGGLRGDFTVEPGKPFTLTWSPLAEASIYWINIEPIDDERGGYWFNTEPWVTATLNEVGRYRWRVYAKNDVRRGPLSEWAYFTVENMVLPAPTGLTPSFTAIVGEQFMLSWNPIVGALQYEIRLEALGPLEHWEIDYGSNDPSLQMSHTEAGQYRWRVSADSESLTPGLWSEWMYYTVDDPASIKLPAPTGLTPAFTVKAGENFALTWDPVAGALRYEISVESVGQTEYWEMDYLSNEPSLAMLHTKTGQYRWKVCADSEWLTGGLWSDWIYYTVTELGTPAVSAHHMYLPLTVK